MLHFVMFFKLIRVKSFLWRIVDTPWCAFCCLQTKDNFRPFGNMVHKSVFILIVLNHIFYLYL